MSSARWGLGPLLLFFSLVASSAFAQGSVVDDTYCTYQDRPAALRQTVLIIDGGIIVPEPEGPLPENQQWRRFVTQFLDNSDQLVRQRVDARERVTVGVANADGSGLTILFSGCVPLFRLEEETELDAKTNVFDTFFGNDWRRAFEKDGEKFRRQVSIALISGIKGLPAAGPAPMPFMDGALVSALTKSVGYSLERGIPRVVVYSDLSRYQFPTSDLPTVRTAGRTDGERAAIDLMRAEVHLFGATGAQTDAVKNYLEAFFLTSKGHLATLNATGGAMVSLAPPRSVEMYQGTIAYPDADYPVKMRLALDQSGAVVNSWIEVQSALSRFVPFSGIMDCAAELDCQYVGDNIFAQIWDDNPDAKADLQAWQPFGGMRGFTFALKGPSVNGLVKDEQGYIVGKEDGLVFSMSHVPNGLF